MYWTYFSNERSRCEACEQEWCTWKEECSGEHWTAFKVLKEYNKEDRMYYKTCCLNTEDFFLIFLPLPPLRISVWNRKFMGFFSDQVKLFFSSLMPLNMFSTWQSMATLEKNHSCPTVCWLSSCSEGCFEYFWTCCRNLNKKYGNIKVLKLQSSLKELNGAITVSTDGVNTSMSETKSRNSL